MTSGLSKEETALSLNHPGGSARGRRIRCSARNSSARLWREAVCSKRAAASNTKASDAVELQLAGTIRSRIPNGSLAVLAGQPPTRCISTFMPTASA